MAITGPLHLQAKQEEKRKHQESEQLKASCGPVIAGLIQRFGTPPGSRKPLIKSGYPVKKIENDFVALLTGAQVAAGIETLFHELAPNDRIVCDNPINQHYFHVVGFKKTSNGLQAFLSKTDFRQKKAEARKSIRHEKRTLIQQVADDLKKSKLLLDPGQQKVFNLFTQETVMPWGALGISDEYRVCLQRTAYQAGHRDVASMEQYILNSIIEDRAEEASNKDFFYIEIGSGNQFFYKKVGSITSYCSWERCSNKNQWEREKDLNKNIKRIKHQMDILKILSNEKRNYHGISIYSFNPGKLLRVTDLQRFLQQECTRKKATIRKKLDQLSEGWCCSICLEPMMKASRTQCNHAFHAQCINRWSVENVTCPLCRQRTGHTTTIETPLGIFIKRWGLEQFI